MIYKWYACEYVDISGSITGSRIERFFVLTSPYAAYIKLTEAGGDRIPINFRRVK